jgi:hypothetical protein
LVLLEVQEILDAEGRSSRTRQNVAIQLSFVGRGRPRSWAIGLDLAPAGGDVSVVGKRDELLPPAVPIHSTTKIVTGRVQFLLGVIGVVLDVERRQREFAVEAAGGDPATQR